jgi:DNA repair exonuclease SbcCD ATPase subunit
MIRFACLFLFLAMPSWADAQVGPLDALRKTAEKASADWEALAKGLELKISTLLPCDPRAKAAVEEVSRASEARLAALSTYLKAAAAEAKADTEAAKRVLGAQAALSGGWNTERAEADQQRMAIEAQIADLKESMRKRGSLAAAENVLNEIDTLVKARGTKAEELAGRKDSIEAMLGNLVVAYHDRQAAFEKESALLDAEIPKWNAYYSTRVSRAVTECSIINPGAAPRKRRP